MSDTKGCLGFLALAASVCFVAYAVVSTVTEWL